MRKLRASAKRVYDQEEEVIGNLKAQFKRPTLNGQRKIGISPDIANGNISLSYYRGLAVSREETIADCYRILKKKYPRVARFLLNQLGVNSNGKSV